MRRVALIYNPASGQHSRFRDAAIDDALEVLRAAGIEAEVIKTYARGSAALQAVEAVERGCDTILACGGDGTVHEILQSLVGTQVALGVVPLGTANALAANLGLGPSPAQAIRRLVHATPEQVPVGLIHYRDSQGKPGSRYFTVAAGVGADALVMSRLNADLKRRFGYLLYLVEGVRVLVSHAFPFFTATFQKSAGRGFEDAQVTQILAVRIRDFGGLLRHLAPGATLRRNSLCVLACTTRSRIDLLRFLIAVVFRSHSFYRRIELLDVVSMECAAPGGASKNIYVEADGELLGTLPVRIEIAPQTLTLLVPSDVHP
jgi:YegS/Rv2252/BmrU family lipid kinase